MKKKKVISHKNLPFTIRIIPFIVCFWFLWDKLPYEWVRTLLVLVFALNIIGWLWSLVTYEEVDIFRKEDA